MIPDPSDPQIFSHVTWNDPWGIIGVEWENISISGIRLKRFNSVFRLMRNATFFGYKREIFSKWLVDYKVIFSYINYLEFTFSVIMWRPLYQTDGTVVPKCFQFRPSLVAVCWTFYRKISRIQQCRGPRGLQLWFYSAIWRASSRETKTNLQMWIHACKRLPR